MIKSVSDSGNGIGWQTKKKKWAIAEWNIRVQATVE